jgi:GT2 family glycosyltransferase
MAKPLVTIGLVLYKGEKYLKLALESLMAQDYPNVEYLFRDQGPEGEATAFIRTQLPDIFAKIKIEKGENLMHGGGHNALMRQMKGDYYLCCSNDMLYPPDLVSKLVAEMEKPENQAVGSATPKLMFWDFEKAINCDLEGSKTNRIDSFGIAISHAHRFSEIGAGEEDLGRYDHQTSIFGSSGALSFYRKKALNDVAYINSNGSTEYYDSLLHYKNDCDLSYRLQWAGWKSLFLSMAKVWHDRFNGNQSQSPS